MPEAPAVLAIDQGSSSTKSLLVGIDGTITGVASAPLATRYPRPGWVEHDAEALWGSVREAVGETLAQAQGRAVVALGISNQRESVVAWDRASGLAVGPVVSWQCRRTAERCERLRDQTRDGWVRSKTGLPIDPTFSATKMAWLLDNLPDARRRARAGELCLGTIDAWLLWRLSGGARFATDAGNASRTQLLDLRRLAWDEALLGLFEVPREVLPEVLATASDFARTVKGSGVPAGVPIAALAADSHAALFGHLASDAGAVKATYGTGSSLMGAVSAEPREVAALASTVAWAMPGARYALEGNVTSTGAAVAWTRRLLGVEDQDAFDALVGDERMGDADPGELVFVPAFSGLAAPHWVSAARGLIAGITLDTGRQELARAALGSVAMQVADVFEAFRAATDSVAAATAAAAAATVPAAPTATPHRERDPLTSPATVPAASTATPAASLLADGGGSRSDALMQLQADVIGVPVLRSRSQHLSALGAAYMAGLQVGLWGSVERDLRPIRQPVDVFEPRWSEGRRSEARRRWRSGVDTAIAHAARSDRVVA